MVGAKLEDAVRKLEELGHRVKVTWTAPPQGSLGGGGMKRGAADSVQSVPRAAHVVRQRYLPAETGSGSDFDVELVAALVRDGLRREV